MLRIMCIIMGLVGVLLTAMSINDLFWNKPIFNEKISETQKAGNYVPYRVRKIIWSRQMAIAKIETERIINLIWIDKWINIYGLFLIVPILLGISYKYWPEILITITIVAIGVINDNPDPKYFDKFLLFPLFPMIISGLRKIFSKWPKKK